MEQILQSSKSYSKWIMVISVVIPVVVAVLLFAPVNLSFEKGGWIQILPTLNAVINSATAVLLLAALAAIKARRTTLHRNLMMTALGLGTLFLLSYVLYHASTVSTVYGDINHDGVLSDAERAEIGGYRTVYLLTLLSHIALSIVVVPFVLFAFYYALTGQFVKHTKIVKYTFPVWLYVSVTGVIVYLMISPYYL
ncbi:DUF420 domain-containing protein [Marinoscillum sp.]|uniref:DUF420 domain-containing protein n=1 Tax=Marinoscillum sp. TaxID=2024838 RepID=UPI003BAC4070